MAICKFDISGKTFVRKFEDAHSSPMTCAEIFCREKFYCVIGDCSGGLKLLNFECEDNNCRTIGKTFDSGHDEEFITSVCVNEASSKVISASTKSLVVWDLAGVKFSEVFEKNLPIKPLAIIENAHNGTTIWKILINDSDRHLYSVGQDKTLKIWDLGVGSQIKFLKSLTGSHDGELYSLGVDSENRRLFTTGLDKKIGVWNIDRDGGKGAGMPKSQNLILTCHDRRVWCMTVTKSYVFTGSYDKKVFRWRFKGP
jgi:WD40 repeat protein